MKSNFEFYLHVRGSDDFTEESTNVNANANVNVKPSQSSLFGHLAWWYRLMHLIWHALLMVSQLVSAKG